MPTCVIVHMPCLVPGRLVACMPALPSACLIAGLDPCLVPRPARAVIDSVARPATRFLSLLRAALRRHDVAQLVVQPRIVRWPLVRSRQPSRRLIPQPTPGRRSSQRPVPLSRPALRRCQSCHPSRQPIPRSARRRPTRTCRLSARRAAPHSLLAPRPVSSRRRSRHPVLQLAPGDRPS